MNPSVDRTGLASPPHRNLWLRSALAAV